MASAPETPPPLTLELVARIRAGDRSAWNELYTSRRDALLFAVRCRLGPALRRRLDSEDVLQSVMLEALRELPKFAPRGEGSLRHFLHVLITRKIQDRADTFGAAKRRGEVALEDAGVDPPDPRGVELGYVDAERFERLERALARLPEDLREIVLLRKVDGLTSSEIAAMQGRTDDAVRKHASRAMARLARLMEDEPPTDAPCTTTN